MTELKELDMNNLIFESLDMVNNRVFSNILGGSCVIKMKVNNVVNGIVYLEFLNYQNNEYHKVLELEDYIIDYFSKNSEDLMGKFVSKHVFKNMFRSIINLPNNLQDMPYIKVLPRSNITAKPGYLVNVELIFDKIIFMESYYYIICILNQLEYDSNMDGGSNNDELSVSSYSNTSNYTSSTE